MPPRPARARWRSSAATTTRASPTFGKLDFLGEVRDGVDGADGLNLARGLALSPDDAHLYVVGEADNAVAVFARNAGPAL